MSTEQPKDPTSRSYYDKSAGKKRVFKPVAGRFVARLRDRLEGPLSLPGVGDLELVGGDNEPDGVVVLEAAPGKSAPEGDPEAPAAGAGGGEQPGGAVRAIISAFEDEDGQEVFFLPDEVAVQFKREVRASRTREVLRRTRIKPIREYGDPHLAVGETRPEELFDAVNSLAERDEVEIAGPVMWAFERDDDEG